MNLDQTFMLVLSLLAELLHEVVVLGANAIDLCADCIHLALKQIICTVHFSYSLLQILPLQSMVLLPVFLVEQ